MGARAESGVILEAIPTHVDNSLPHQVVNQLQRNKGLLLVGPIQSNPISTFERMQKERYFTR